MDALMYGRTVFVIAHRLSTVKNADVIMVLDHGRIIERSSHDQLIAARAQLSHQLYTGAFELGDALFLPGNPHSQSVFVPGRLFLFRILQNH